MSCPSSCCSPFRTQCDRSAVGALRVEVPRVARRLAALARARPTAITYDRSAVVQWARLQSASGAQGKMLAETDPMSRIHSDIGEIGCRIRLPKACNMPR